MAEPFKLSAALTGHDDDVRAVSVLDSTTILSGSRDASVRKWTFSSSPPKTDYDIISHGSAFINTVAYIPQSQAYPDGLVVSGSGDGIIEVKAPTKRQDDNADALLIGHANNVCALHVREDGKVIISGSWDMTARIWTVGKWSDSDSTVLRGHEASVWAVLAYDEELIITGSADKFIRLYDYRGKVLKKFQGSEDVVRALVKLPKGDYSGAQFASAGNDNKIRLWTLTGIQIAELYGHENFIYSLAILPSGELISSSEDRTVRVWHNGSCIQTITHPAISVWSVAVNSSNGDIVSGSSDKIIRVFSRQKERQADSDTLKQFEDQIQQSSIPQQSLGDINKTDMPGPEFLQQKSGTKDGQVQLIKESNGNVAAYQWSVQGNEWVNVGTVVDSAGSTSKVTYNGQDYDYVFDVDIEDGKPPLKLPYNVNQNPYEAARKFIEVNELPISYLDEVTNFITRNTGGAAIGTQSQSSAPGSDPWGTENRYRPEDQQNQSQSSSQPQPQPSSKILPQKEYLVISTANHQMILKKIGEFSEQLQELKLSISSEALQSLSTTISQLEPLAGKREASLTIPNDVVKVTLNCISSWPEDKRLPLLDLLRLQVAASASPVTYFNDTNTSTNLINALAATSVFEPSTSPNNTMLSIRSLANLFASPAGRTLADTQFDDILSLVAPHNTQPTSNKNLAIALTTLYINYAVHFTTSERNPDRALALLAALLDVLKTVQDPEAVYRALVASGTVLVLGKDFADVAREGLDIDEALAVAEKTGKSEDRIKVIISEIRGLLRPG